MEDKAFRDRIKVSVSTVCVRRANHTMSLSKQKEVPALEITTKRAVSPEIAA